MALVATIVISSILAGIFGWLVPLAHLFDAFQPLITSLSIMVAAIFVRLNRGMPSLEWKSVEPQRRSQLTSKVVSLAEDYAWIIAIAGAALLGFATLSIIGKASATSWPNWAQRAISAFFGFEIPLIAARMTYVVWRDVDIVRLQKMLIDMLASRDVADAQAKVADAKMAEIRGAGLRKVEQPAPRPWSE